MNKNTIDINSKEDFYNHFKKGGGFAKIYWHEDDIIEDKLKSDLKVTARCIPLNADEGKCIFSGKPGKLTVFAKAY